MSDVLLVDQHDGLVHVRLNRPQALNALSTQMIIELLPILLGDNPVLVSGEGRAFCAGGDVKAVWQALQRGEHVEYFDGEYHVNAALYARDNTYVSYLNGITMGGGYGISAHGSHIVVCENTVFAMPEVKIGFFPDVGAAYPLSRAPYELGAYMGVTGNAITGDDMVFTGLANAYVPKDAFDAFKNMMAQEGIDAAITACGITPQTPGLFRQHHALIERTFNKDSVEEIVSALEAEDSDIARSILEDMSGRCPLSMKVALKHMRMARHDDFETVITRDSLLSKNMMAGPNFNEGVRAVLIDKDNAPQWTPATLAEVDSRMLGLYFGETEG